MRFWKVLELENEGKGMSWSAVQWKNSVIGYMILKLLFLLFQVFLEESSVFIDTISVTNKNKSSN